MCRTARRNSSAIWAASLCVAGRMRNVAVDDFRLPETVETAVLCSLSCGRGLGRGLTAAAEKLVCAATVLPSPRPSPTGEGAVCWGFAGCRSSENWGSRFSGSLWECRLFSVLVLASQKLSLASQDVVFRLPATVEAAVLCSLSCGRGLGRGLAAAAEKLVCVATVLPSPQPSPTGEGAGCCGFAGRRSSENV